jgi:glycerol-3-phosphate O-acyltransferase / dihydroxyacetone phosphate acyltransferase
MVVRDERGVPQPTPPHEGPLRAGLRWLFRRISRIYFRELEVVGEIPTGDVGARLFAANHFNALVDPILVLTQAPCPISPVAKSTLWKIPALRWLLDVADAVPIVRRRDDPNKSAASNDAVFERVSKHLRRGGNVLIFPEGTSHNEPKLTTLRSGAGRMLARAKEEGGVGLTFQGVALEFDERDVFRSRALVLFGPARRVTDAPKDADVAEWVTETIREDLRELLVEGETWDERRRVARVAEILANDARDSSLERWNALGRKVEEAVATLRGLDAAAVEEVGHEVDAYFEVLARAGTTDALVARGGQIADRTRLGSAARLSLVLPFALMGAALYWVPYQIPRLVTRRFADDPDVSSTYKLGVGLVIFPLWAALAVAAAWTWLPAAAAAIASFLTLTCPFAALAWLDRWETLAAKSRLLLPSRRRDAWLVSASERRRALIARIEELREAAERGST